MVLKNRTPRLAPARGGLGKRAAHPTCGGAAPSKALFALADAGLLFNALERYLVQ
jgi:hypothetical protein